MLDGAQQTQGVMALAFEGEHRVDDVLEDPRPGQRPVLGDVTDHHDRHTTSLGLADEVLGTLPHLGDGAGRRREPFVGDRLDAVDDDETG